MTKTSNVIACTTLDKNNDLLRVSLEALGEDRLIIRCDNITDTERSRSIIIPESAAETLFGILDSYLIEKKITGDVWNLGQK